MRDLYRGDGGPLNDYDQGWNDGVEAAEKALRAEVEALRVDAERYRWLRENDSVYPAPHYHDDVASNQKIDWSIDRAMAKERKEAK